MAVRIRLSRGGSKKRPFYRIVVADSRSPRDGRFIERLGSYNPLLPAEHVERVVLDVEKTKSWLAKGALPTDRLEKIMAKLGLCAAPCYAAQDKQTQPRAKAQERIKEKEVKALEKIEAEKMAAEKAKEEAAAAKAAAEAPVASAEVEVEQESA